MLIKNYFSLLLILFLFPLFGQESKKISLQNANVLKYNKEINPDIQIVSGNVIFEHNSSLLFCDSALFYINDNAVKAMGNILLKINDSVSAKGDELFYDGKTKIATLKGKEVELRDNNIRLLTKELVYDINNQKAYYLSGGTIQDPQNTLKSKHGFYFTDRKEFFFRYSVQAQGDKYILTSDSMLYNTTTEMLSFFGKTHIIYDSTHLWFKHGWYKTKQHVAKAWDSAVLMRSTSILKADTIVYNDSTKIGIGIRYVYFQDTLERAAFTAHFMRFREQDSSLLLSDSALFYTWEKSKDTLFLHGDTLFAFKDTSRTRHVIAYYKVRFFHPSLQGICDSLHYSTADSTLKLYHFPIVWYENVQSSADTIHALVSQNKLRQVKLLHKAFIHYPYKKNDFNQLKGRHAFLFFKNNELQSIIMQDNAEIIYFIEDSTKGTAINYSQAYKIKILLSPEQRELDKVIFYKQIEGTLYPYNELSEERKKLQGFQNNEALRPKSVQDLFK